jgi:hypothetical protein
MKATKCIHRKSWHLADNGSGSAGDIRWCPDCGSIAIGTKWYPVGTKEEA